MALNIPQSVFTKYEEVCDYLLSHNAFSRVCTLTYPANRVTTTNTPYIAGGNIYQHGGPANEGADGNIYQGGESYKDSEATETIRLRIYWNRKKWINGGGVDIADADVQVIGLLSDLPKLLACESVELVSEQKTVVGGYKLLGQPFYHGFGKNKYFIAFLKKA